MSRVPGSGGMGSHQGTPKLNKERAETAAEDYRTSRTRDQDGWPSMNEMAKSILKGKQ